MLCDENFLKSEHYILLQKLLSQITFQVYTWYFWKGKAHMRQWKRSASKKNWNSGFIREILSRELKCTNILKMERIRSLDIQYLLW